MHHLLSTHTLMHTNTAYIVYITVIHIQECHKQDIWLPSIIQVKCQHYKDTRINNAGHILYLYHKLDSPHSSLNPSLSTNHLNWYVYIYTWKFPSMISMVGWQPHKNEISDPHSQKYFLDQRTCNKGSMSASILSHVRFSTSILDA